MEINKILQADYLDLVFENRNKAYGSYELRKHYNQRALQAFGVLVAAVVLSVAIPAFIGKFLPKKSMATLPTTYYKTTVVSTIDRIFEEKKIEPLPIKKEVKQPNASIAKTIAFPPPKIVKDVDVPKEIPSVKELSTAVVGAVTNPGNGGIETATTTKVPVGPPVLGNVTGDPHVTTPSITQPVNVADVMPEYPGGMEALLKYLQQNLKYPSEAREVGIQGRVTVKFVVNEMGKVENAVVLRGIGGGCDKEALRVVNAMKGWKPGMVQGKAVKVYYTLPITFKLGDS